MINLLEKYLLEDDVYFLNNLKGLAQIIEKLEDVSWWEEMYAFQRAELSDIPAAPPWTLG